MSDDRPPQRGVPSPLQGGPVAFGPFWLDARLAVGGTAEVYLARPQQGASSWPPKLVVKRLLPQFMQDAEGRTMFEREARLHKCVTHPNVVQVFGSGHDDGGEPFLAMEFIDGVDLYRLLRRLNHDGQSLPVHVAVWIARALLEALSGVHNARDAKHNLLGIIHRDVTPSNVYLSAAGDVKLGDFGIARASRMTMRSVGSAMLKGKFAYLAPEQVAAEPFDHRADLFSMGSVLAEMLLGSPLFSGSGQLAVLLAIRDCNLSVLHEASVRFPSGLITVLETALSKSPSGRYESAESFARALGPYCADPNATRIELAALINWARSAASSDSIAAVRESIRSLRRSFEADEVDIDVDDDFSRPTGEYQETPSFADLADGSRLGPLTYAKLVEALATGAISRGDRVSYQGSPAQPVETIEQLARFVPADTITSMVHPDIGSPDFADALTYESLVRVFMQIGTQQDAGVLFAEGTGPEGRMRKELYFRAGRLHHVASSDASELLGEYLVRKSMLSREELNFALAVLPRYGGRMGDTLISLGLVSAFDVFRAIREQGHDRVINLFQWPEGTLAYYRGETSPVVEFPLDLELPPLMLSGTEATWPDESILSRYRPALDEKLAPTALRRQSQEVLWPALVARIVDWTGVPRTARELIMLAHGAHVAEPPSVLRCIELLRCAGLIA